MGHKSTGGVEGGLSLSGAGQEGSAGGAPGFELRKTRTFLRREEAVGGGEEAGREGCHRRCRVIGHAYQDDGF